MPTTTRSVSHTMTALSVLLYFCVFLTRAFAGLRYRKRLRARPTARCPRRKHNIRRRKKRFQRTYTLQQFQRSVGTCLIHTGHPFHSGSSSSVGDVHVLTRYPSLPTSLSRIPKLAGSSDQPSRRRRKVSTTPPVPKSYTATAVINSVSTATTRLREGVTESLRHWVDWTCSCGYVNFQRRSRCRSCDLPKLRHLSPCPTKPKDQCLVQ